MTDELLQKIVDSGDPTEGLQNAIGHGPTLRRLSQHVFGSQFSLHVGSHPPSWFTCLVETALSLLHGSDVVSRYGRDWLLEIAFHGSLPVAGNETFDKRLDQITAALHSLERSGATRSSQYVKGLLAYARDDLEAAERAFSSLPSLAERFPPYQGGYVAFRSPNFYQTLVNYRPSLELKFLQRPKRLPRDATILLCALDQVYFDAFAKEFAEHVYHVSPSAHIHFHLVNPSEGAIKGESWTSDRKRISITTEICDAPRPGIYAIMARYMVLPVLMQLWRRPVLVTDVDLVVRNDPGVLSSRTAVTLGFSTANAAHYVPSTSILGGHNLFQPSEGGIRFAQLMSRYLHYMFINGRALFAADQIALLIVWLMLRDSVDVGGFQEQHPYRYGPMADRVARKHAAKEALREKV